MKNYRFASNPRKPLILSWCERGDSNPHAREGTRS